MICPYQDIGCFYIDDISHECERPCECDCPRDLRGYEIAYHAPEGWAYSRRRYIDDEEGGE